MKLTGESIYYVYAYFDPFKKGEYNYEEFKFDYEPFYIGKGKGNRLNIHLNENEKCSNKHKYYKIKQIKEKGHLPTILIVKSGLTHSESVNLEIKLIKDIGRRDLKTGPLCNLTDGGEGSFGRILSSETKEKMKICKIGKYDGVNNPMYGRTGENAPGYKRKFSKETLKLMSERVSGNKNPMYGKGGMRGTKNPMSKHYELIDPENNVHHVFCLIEFIRTNNLKQGFKTGINQVFNNKREHYKGWKGKRL